MRNLFRKLMGRKPVYKVRAWNQERIMYGGQYTPLGLLEVYRKLDEQRTKHNNS